MKVMKMQLLIGSLILFIISCNNSSKNECVMDLDNYKFLSVKYFKNEKFDINKYDVMSYIKSSKSIKGPVKGIIVKELKIINEQKNDTISIIIYGNNHKYFRIKNCYYESKKPILPIGIF